uniref:Aspartyl/glutamyl-tRNA(Asn/Gln) amidotransferase subunit C n=1 Tax=Lygus hesperus TaxID=30085 RepID=A0A0A9YE90_LYGHE
MSMNLKRCSLQILRKTRRFVLSVPVAGMENTLRTIGKNTGRPYFEEIFDDKAGKIDTDGVEPPVSPYRDKLESLGLDVCKPGWRPMTQEGCDVIENWEM